MFLPFMMAVAVANGPVLVARSERCNVIVANELQDQARNFEKHPPKPPEFDARIDALKQVLADADREAQVLRSVCPGDDQPAKLSQLDATRALVFALESDIARDEYAQDCPAQLSPVVSGFVAQAWLSLVRATPTGANPTPFVLELTPKIKARADAVHLALPVPADTSNYWVTTVQDTGRQAAEACPTPSPK